MLPARILHSPAVAGDSQVPTGHTACPGASAVQGDGRVSCAVPCWSQPASSPLAQPEPALSTLSNSGSHNTALAANRIAQKKLNPSQTSDVPDGSTAQGWFTTSQYPAPHCSRNLAPLTLCVNGQSPLTCAGVPSLISPSPRALG